MIHLTISFLCLLACNDKDTATEDTATEDTAAEDTAAEDTATEDTATEDTATEDTATEEEPVPAALTLSPTTLSFTYIGESGTISSTVTDESGAELTDAAASLVTIN